MIDQANGRYVSVMLIHDNAYAHKQGTLEEARQDADKMQVEIDHRPWGVKDLATGEIVYRTRD